MLNVRALVVDDDPHVARFLERVLGQAGFSVEVARDGAEAADWTRISSFDLLVLDVVMPTMDGFEMCRGMRERGVTARVLMLTGQSSVQDRIKGLDCGADDYLVKPFDVAELMARVRALLRRPAGAATVLKVGDLELDPASRRVVRGGRSIPLSTTEYNLLEYLVRNANRVLTRSMILSHVWRQDFEGNDNVLDVYISYLRGKIDKGHAYPLIHTMRGCGYRLGPY